MGAHIARWADAPELRGKLENGLCLCLMNYKAFEVGMFVVSRDCVIQINTHINKVANNFWFLEHVLPFDGQTIRKGTQNPTEITPITNKNSFRFIAQSVKNLQKGQNGDSRGRLEISLIFGKSPLGASPSG